MIRLEVGDIVLHRLDHRKMLVIEVGRKGGYLSRAYRPGQVLCHYVDSDGHYQDEWFLEEVLAR